ncbi:MAG: Hsp70 family protein, partial [Deltaproteobacteria bacterium]
GNSGLWGPPGAPGLPPGSGTGSPHAGMPGVAARPPVHPGHLGQPSMPPPPLPLLLDVTPHTLGLETVGGMCETVIARNSTIPVEQTREFATSYDDQEAVKIRIAQGESRRFGENQALGELELSGLPRGPRGEVRISVTFELDADGTLQVRARDPVSGRETRTRVTLLTMPTAGAMAAMTQRQRTQA